MIKFRFAPVELEIDTQQFADDIYQAARNVSTFFDARDIVASDLTPYPPRRQFPQDYPLEWTDAERRAYFAAVNRGETTFPYQRTDELFNGWQIETRKSGGGATVTIANNVKYVPDVVGTFQSEGMQKKYHRITGWLPLVETTPHFIERLQNSVQEELQLITDASIVRTL